MQSIGLSVTLRVRMAASDAHYAGGLVDGARLLSLFGDVATELLIRSDGDEGLFRAYESVEFLAPVFAGDYLEARGVIVGVGTTSRKMAFEARKVVGGLRDSGRPPSAAEALSEPLIVCRAVGTCVVPKLLQSRPRLHAPGLPGGPEAAALAEPKIVVPPAPHTIVPRAPAGPSEVVLTAALVGAEVGPEQTPHLPITPDQIADEAARCRDAGASIVHLHVRDPNGRPTQALERYQAAIEAIAK